MRCFLMNPRFFIIWVLRPPNGLFGAPRRDLRGGSLGSPRGVGRGPAGARDGVRPGVPGGSGGDPAGGWAGPSRGVDEPPEGGGSGPQSGPPRGLDRDPRGLPSGRRRGPPGNPPKGVARTRARAQPTPPAPCSRGWASGGGRPGVAPRPRERVPGQGPNGPYGARKRLPKRKTIITRRDEMFSNESPVFHNLGSPTPQRTLRGPSPGPPRGVGRGPAGARDGVRPGLPGGSGGDPA